jgi:glycosyltransferase involved in cell wall biosynthesis
VFIYGLTGGGATRRTLTLAAAFAERGHRVDLVLISAEGPLLPDLPSSVRVVPLNSPLARVASWVGLKKRRHQTNANILALAGYLLRERPDVLMSAANHAHLAALFASRLALRRVPIVLRVSTHLTQSRLGSATRKRPQRLWIERRCYAWADAIIAVASGIAEDLAANTAIPPERITAVRNPTFGSVAKESAEEPLDHPWFSSNAPPVLLAAGRLAPGKDFETLVRAFARVRSHRLVRLVLLGEGKERPRIEALIRELGLEEDALLPGFVRNPFPWMSRAAVFVLSSAWEGSPGVLIEAMACGCPIVSTDCPSGPAEILVSGEYGRLVAVGDDEGLAQAILETLDAPRDSARLQSRASEFDVDTAVDGYLDVLSRVC